MCGFVAIVSSDNATPDRGLLARMSETISHRGPDDSGIFAEAGVGLAFRRLSILDLAPSGHQPMLSPDQRHVIVFNGEIFNYIELRTELEGLGHTFRSTGDTEVLLTAYRQWGTDCLRRFNGMWAFVIYDRVERTLFGARDRFGVKPLFWHRSGNSLVFASEIKAIRDSAYTSLQPDWSTVSAFLLEGRLDQDDASFYAGVTRVPAGTAFMVDAEARMKTWRHWSLEEAGANAEAPADPVESFAELFEDAVRVRLRSDVPVGVLLSGGMDSTSIICSMARGLSRETIASGNGFNAFCYMAPEFDETAFIDATLSQTNATLRKLDTSPRKIWDTLASHLWYQDEPVHSFTSVVGHQLMQLARGRSVKVLLNGQGADETLAGYPSYFDVFWADLVRKGRLWAALNEMRAHKQAYGGSSARSLMRSAEAVLRQKFANLPAYSKMSADRRSAAVQQDSWVSPDIHREWRPLERLQGASLTDTLRWSVERSPLPLYLRVEDRNSMAHSVEVRLPFLDYRLVTLAFSLGSQWKLRGAFNKFILRQAMRNRIPENVRQRALKMGFPTAVDDWFRTDLYEPMKDLLASRVARESGAWNVRTVSDALERHRRGEISVGNRLFHVAQYCLWMEGNRVWPQSLPARPATVALVN